MSIIDSNGNFLPVRRLVKIGRDPQVTYNLDAFVLLLPSGKGCIGSEYLETCLEENKAFTSNQATVKVLDSSTGEIVSGAKVSVESLDSKGSYTTVSSQYTDTEGKVTFPNLETGSYSLLIESSGYAKKRLDWVYQGVAAVISFYITRETGDAYKVELDLYRQQFDMRLNMKFQSVSSGAQCHVSLLNPSCGYSKYEGGQRDTSMGIERATVNRFTDSIYMVYTESGVSASTCSRLDVVTKSHFVEIPRSLNSQEKFFFVSHCFTSFGERSIKIVNQKMTSEPSIEVCNIKYPTYDVYHPSRLQSGMIE